ncbi:MAG: pyridoxine 5'-phosphate synthase [Candidatus Omnitrophota bacterium]|nr:pyridoxine 5'-phosphate synthase [Candidatus Omnitrophota bacterium]
MVKLGVNIDHVATVREARKTFEPDPVDAARECEKAGCDGIVCHLRKDRRHINDTDLSKLKKAVTTRLNLEMSVDREIVDIACGVVPDQATLVPENRQEITTEGGLDVSGNFDRIKNVIDSLASRGIEVSLFIDPEPGQVESSILADAKMIEFHTGRYAEEFNSGGDHELELENLRKMTEFAIGKGLTVCAGHGLNYGNVTPVARIEGLHELNIGHSIISRSVFAGIGEAVRQMKELVA